MEVLAMWTTIAIVLGVLAAIIGVFYIYSKLTDFDAQMERNRKKSKVHRDDAEKFMNTIDINKLNDSQEAENLRISYNNCSSLIRDGLRSPDRIIKEKEDMKRQYEEYVAKYPEEKEKIAR